VRSRLAERQASAALHAALPSERWGLFKADIDSAFRRVPIQASHRSMAYVVYRLESKIMASMHDALPFGAGPARASAKRARVRARACAGAHARSLAVASVHGWERVGSLLTTILRHELRAVILRYVDDLFGIGRDSGSEVPQDVPVDLPRERAPYGAQAAHALECAVRIIRALMGQSAISAKKVEHGNPLVILGLRIKVSARVERCRQRVRATGAAAPRRLTTVVSLPGRPTTNEQSGAPGSGRRCALVSCRRELPRSSQGL